MQYEGEVHDGQREGDEGATALLAAALAKNAFAICS
jgi:hypothetical protein